MHDRDKLGLLYFIADDVARDDVAQADDVAVNDLSYDDVSLNKRENKNIILIIFKLHMTFYYEKITMTWQPVTCHLMPRHTMPCHLMTCGGPR